MCLSIKTAADNCGYLLTRNHTVTLSLTLQKAIAMIRQKEPPMPTLLKLLMVHQKLPLRR